MAEKIVVIVGPTASGKTRVSIEIAKRFNGSILSADSMQIYKHMNIGTAKPTTEEQQDVCHYLMDIVEPYQEFTVANYLYLANQIVNQVLLQKKLPIFVGGTGQYVSSFMNNIHLTQMGGDLNYRSFLQNLAISEGNYVLKQLLFSIDPESAKKIHVNNLKRLIRALEIYRTSGITMTEQNQRSKIEKSPYEFCLIGLTFGDRQKLYDRINDRVEQMFCKGLEAEVRNLYDKGILKEGMNAFQAIGYKQFLPYFQGKCSLDDVKEMIKIESRHYAKRQLTWWRQNEHIHWFEVDSFDEMDLLINKIVKTIEIFIKI